MCAPAALLVASTLFTVGAGVMQAQSASDVAKYEAKVANQNAELDDARAAQAAAIGSIQEERHRAQVRQMAGSQRANFAARGVDLGSGVVQDMLDETYTFGETDALTIRFNAMNEAWGYQTQAVNNRNAAAGARYRGRAERIGTLLTTAAGAGGQLYQGYQSGAFGRRGKTKSGGTMKAGY